jgi:hypothetical protein
VNAAPFQTDPNGPAYSLLSSQLVSDDPDDQVEQTIAAMRHYAARDASSPEIQRDAASILNRWPDDPVAGVFDFVRSGVRFEQDEKIGAPVEADLSWPVIEVLMPPSELSRMCTGSEECTRAGDCDDFSMWAASLLLALGIPCAFVTVAADSREPDRYSHVYVAAYPPGRGRIALDTSHGPFPGWEVGNRFGKRKEWPLKQSKILETLKIAAALAALCYAVYWGASALGKG